MGRPVAFEARHSTGDGGPDEQNRGEFPPGVKVPDEAIAPGLLGACSERCSGKEEVR